jgi:hypothetical protein
MRVFCAAAMLAILAAPAYGQQGNKTPGAPAAPPKSQKEIEAERSAEKAYQNSLKSIPDKPPADPWGNARNVETPKAFSKVAHPTQAGSSAK